MTSANGPRIKEWIASNTAAAVWSILLGVGVALFLLPLDTQRLQIVLATPAITLLAMLFVRRRWLLVATLGLIVSACVNIITPLFSNDRDTYFVRCPNLPDCVTTWKVSDSGRVADVYPVLDPIKWAVWDHLAKSKPSFRIIETSSTAAGELLLHSPFERALIDLSAPPEERGPAVDLRIRLRVPVLDMDIRSTEANTVKAKTTYSDTRVTVIEWRSPADFDAPGFFAAAGPAGNLQSLSDEVVRADLRARALTAGDWRQVLDSQRAFPGISARSRVRNQLIETMLLNLYFRGNVFSAVKLNALSRALPDVFALNGRVAAGDSVLSAAMLNYINMVGGFRGGFGGGLSHNFSQEEFGYFDEELTALFSLVVATYAGSEKDTGTPADLIKDFRQAWLNKFSGAQETGLDIKKFLDLRTETDLAAAPFMTKPGQRLSSEGLELDRDLFQRVQAQRSRFSSITTDTIREADREPDADNPFQIGVPAAIDIAEKNREILALTSKASPAAREIIAAEAEANIELAERLQLMAAAKLGDTETSNDLLESTPTFSEEFRYIRTLMDPATAADASSKVLRHGQLNCEWYDRGSRDHFIFAWKISVESEDRKNSAAWKAAIPHLYSDFGPGGMCPNYLPGVAMLHAMLKLAEDERARHTRMQLDTLLGGDPAWLRPLYADAGKPHLFESRVAAERLGYLTKPNVPLEDSR
jgi:hypothetical protein